MAIFQHFSSAKNDIFSHFGLNLVTMATETESNKQTLFFVVQGQKYTTH